MTFDDFRQGYLTISDAWTETFQTAVSKLFNQELTVSTTVGEDQALQPVLQELSFPAVWVAFQTTGALELHHAVVLKTQDAARLFGWMTGTEPPESLAADQLDNLKEGFDQIINQLLAGQENGYEFELQNLSVEQVDTPPEGIAETGCSATLNLSVGEDTLPLVHLVWGFDAIDLDDDAQAGSGEMDSLFSEEVGVHPADFENFTNGNNVAPGNQNLNMLMDVEMEVFVELGRKKMLIRDLLKLGKGSVIELDKAAGEPLEIFVNGRKLADGEVVVVDDSFGIRITQIVGKVKDEPALKEA